MKKALQMKGLTSDQAEKISKELTENPELAASLKELESNKEVKALFDKISKEINEKKKSGLDEQYAQALVLGKYKKEMMKHKDVLAPLMSLMQK